MPGNPNPTPDLAQFSYKPDEEPKRKHKRDQPVAGFVKLRDKVVGKCPCTMSLAEAEALMREGFVVLTDNPWPKRIYAVGRDGVLYRFTETVAGQSYHGFPAHGAEYRRDVPADVRERLEQRAIDLGCSREFKRWLENTPP